MNECSAALEQCKLWVKGAWGGDELSLVFLEGATDNMYFIQTLTNVLLI